MPRKNEIDKLLDDYIALCNEVLDLHKDHFPYKQLYNASESIIGDQTINLAIYDDRPQRCYSLQMHDQQFSIEDRDADPSHAWKVNYSYLQHVLENPELYREHPTRLDFDWLLNRAGVKSASSCSKCKCAKKPPAKRKPKK